MSLALLLALACNTQTPGAPDEPSEADDAIQEPATGDDPDEDAGETIDAGTADPPPTSKEPEEDAAGSSAPPDELTIVPGERVGPIRSDTSRADLGRHFPDEALEDTSVGLGEGFEAPGTVIHGDTERAASVVWADQERSRVSQVRELGAAWRTPEGLGIGSTVPELAEVLGPFQFFGFGWDQGGTVYLQGTAREAWQGSLFLRLAPTRGADQLHPLLGDGLFHHDHPHVETLAPQVERVMVGFGD